METIIIKTQKELDAIFRLFSKSSKCSKFGCWVYGGFKSRNGYGKTIFKGKNLDTHRLSYLLFSGKLVKGKDIMHLCDNKSCINPAHLKQASRSDNIKDAISKGIIKTGYNSPCSVLTKGQYDTIVYLRKAGWSFTNISKKMRVASETIRKAYYRHTKTSPPKRRKTTKG
jgi:hypothetical protein